MDDLNPLIWGNGAIPPTKKIANTLGALSSNSPAGAAGGAVGSGMNSSLSVQSSQCSTFPTLSNQGNNKSQSSSGIPYSNTFHILHQPHLNSTTSILGVRNNTPVKYTSTTSSEKAFEDLATFKPIHSPALSAITPLKPPHIASNNANNSEGNKNQVNSLPIGFQVAQAEDSTWDFDSLVSKPIQDSTSTKVSNGDIFDLHFLEKNLPPTNHQANPHEVDLLFSPSFGYESALSVSPSIPSQKLSVIDTRNEVDLLSGFNDIKPIIAKTTATMDGHLRDLSSRQDISQDGMIAQIVSLGYSIENAKSALEVSGNSFEAAIEILKEDATARGKIESQNLAQFETNQNATDMKGSFNAAQAFETASHYGYSIVSSAKKAILFSKKKIVKAVQETLHADASNTKSYRDDYENERWIEDQYESEYAQPVPKNIGQSPNTQQINSSKKPVVTNQHIPDLLIIEDVPVRDDFVALPLKPTIYASFHQIDQSAQLKEQGNILYKSGQYDEAAIYYTNAMKVLPEKHELLIPLYNNRAAAYLKTGQSKDAISDCTHIISMYESLSERSDDLIKALMRRATGYEIQEKWIQAKEDYTMLLKMDSGSKSGMEGYARCQKALYKNSDITSSIDRQSIVSQSFKPSSSPKISRTVQRVVDSAIENLRAKHDALEKEEDNKMAVIDQVDFKLFQWKKGKETNLRALLCSLHTLMWADMGWKQVQLSELIQPSQVKMRYMKAIAKLHPDKLNPNVTTEQKMISNAVFSILNAAWEEFKMQNGMK